MADTLRELSGEYAEAAPLAPGATSAGGPYRGFKVVGGAANVTTTGRPTLADVPILDGDYVLGHFTEIENEADSTGSLVLYEASEGA